MAKMTAEQERAYVAWAELVGYSLEARAAAFHRLMESYAPTTTHAAPQYPTVAPTPRPSQGGGTQPGAAQTPVDSLLRHELMDRCELIHCLFDDVVAEGDEDDPYPPELTAAIEEASGALYRAYQALSKWEGQAPAPIAIPRALAEAWIEDQMGMHKSPAVEAVFVALRAAIGA